MVRIEADIKASALTSLRFINFILMGRSARFALLVCALAPPALAWAQSLAPFSHLRVRRIGAYAHVNTSRDGRSVWVSIEPARSSVKLPLCPLLVQEPGQRPRPFNVSRLAAFRSAPQQNHRSTVFAPRPVRTISRCVVVYPRSQTVLKRYEPLPVCCCPRRQAS